MLSTYKVSFVESYIRAPVDSFIFSRPRFPVLEVFVFFLEYLRLGAYAISAWS